MHRGLDKNRKKKAEKKVPGEKGTWYLFYLSRQRANKNASWIRQKSEEKSSEIFAKKLGEKIGFHHPIFLIMPTSTAISPVARQLSFLSQRVASSPAAKFSSLRKPETPPATESSPAQPGTSVSSSEHYLTILEKLENKLSLKPSKR